MGYANVPPTQAYKAADRWRIFVKKKSEKVVFVALLFAAAAGVNGRRVAANGASRRLGAGCWQPFLWPSAANHSPPRSRSHASRRHASRCRPLASGRLLLATRRPVPGAGCQSLTAFLSQPRLSSPMFLPPDGSAPAWFRTLMGDLSARPDNRTVPNSSRTVCPAPAPRARRAPSPPRLHNQNCHLCARRPSSRALHAQRWQLCLRRPTSH